MVNHDWTPEEDALIRAGRRANLSFYEIAAQLRKTPGQVIGRAHRIDGVERVENPVKRTGLAEQQRRAAYAQFVSQLRSPPPRWTSIPFGPPAKCEWIDGEDYLRRIARGEEVHCGKKIAHGSFCKEHGARAYAGIPVMKKYARGRER